MAEVKFYRCNHCGNIVVVVLDGKVTPSCCGEPMELLVPGTTDVGRVLTYYELLPTDASKGTAVDSLRSHPALAGRTFIAAGDYWHDYEMLLAADVAVAPANADEGIQKVCRYVTVSNNDHAIAKIIREIIPSM